MLLKNLSTKDDDRGEKSGIVEFLTPLHQRRWGEKREDNGRSVFARKGNRSSCVVPQERPPAGRARSRRAGWCCLMRRISTLITRDITLCICSRLRDYNGTTSARSAATWHAQCEERKRAGLIPFHKDGREKHWGRERKGSERIEELVENRLNLCDCNCIFLLLKWSLFEIWRIKFGVRGIIKDIGNI